MKKDWWVGIEIVVGWQLVIEVSKDKVVSEYGLNEMLLDDD